MARQRSSAATVPESVTITYDLFDLPTAQHKAGLAGLVLQIRHMGGVGKSPQPKAIPKVTALTASSATIEFAAEAVQCLFDDLYAAERAVVRVKSKWANAKEVRPPEVVEEEIEEKGPDGKPRRRKVKVKYYFYEQVQAAGNVLRQYITNAPDLWLKLWRDMLWAIPRGNPQSRKPFEDRADGKPCGEGPDAWADLLKAEAARTDNGFHTAEVAGSLWLGAQAVNAESVPFEGRVEQTLLLHFWPLVAQVYAPQMVQADGSNEFVGYVLAIPEVSDLKGFVVDYPRMLGELKKDPRGYRPAEAVIDLPAEGALSFLEHLARLAGEKAEGAEATLNLGSVEFLHQAKIGNNIKTLAAGRVAPRPGLLRAYLRVVGKVGEKPPYANPLVRRGLMLSVLDSLPWYQPFGKMLAEWDSRFFFFDADDAAKQNDRARLARNFGSDVRTLFNDLPEDDMANSGPPTGKLPARQLDAIIHDMARQYVLRRAEIQLKREGEGETDWKKLKAQEAKADAARSAFLALRSRRDQAFIEHFTELFGQFGQFLPMPDDFLAVTTALHDDHERVKTVTLLALSANGYVSRTKTNPSEEQS
jgi:CRISPR-associated protein Cmx8